VELVDLDFLLRLVNDEHWLTLRYGYTVFNVFVITLGSTQSFIATITIYP
jgi:hypothetical protein